MGSEGGISVASRVGMLRPLVFAFMALVVGCAPHWVVVRQASPNPMTLSSRFFVDNVDMEGLRVGQVTEAQWMSDKSAETRERWEGDKRAMQNEFIAGFDNAAHGLILAQTAAEGFTVRAHYVRYEPGFYAGIVAGNGAIDAVIDVLDPGGNIVDEFQVSTESSGMSAGERARRCSRELGWSAAKYLRARLGM
jgi:hypothetical protein